MVSQLNVEVTPNLQIRGPTSKRGRNVHQLILKRPCCRDTLCWGQELRCFITLQVLRPGAVASWDSERPSVLPVGVSLHVVPALLTLEGLHITGGSLDQPQTGVRHKQYHAAPACIAQSLLTFRMVKHHEDGKDNKEKPP